MVVTNSNEQCAKFLNKIDTEINYDKNEFDLPTFPDFSLFFSLFFLFHGKNDILALELFANKC